MNNCKDCCHWQKDENRYNRAIDPEYNPVTGDGLGAIFEWEDLWNTTWTL